MRLSGRIWKSRKNKRLWVIEVPDLDLSTQGTSIQDAFDMIKDAIEGLVDVKNFEVTVHPDKGGVFTLSGSSSSALVSLILERNRIRSDLSLSAVAERMGSKSKNAFAQYEKTGPHGRQPSIEKLDDLLGSLEKELLISVVDKKRA